ncbi:uncharacterized protein [Amphiura filiformis]|uniref:uncharacterized protein n=1 Tax=Amphiura filiformis TaxID=82378 RepID=UPI003B212EF7
MEVVEVEASSSERKKENEILNTIPNAAFQCLKYDICEAISEPNLKKLKGICIEDFLEHGLKAKQLDNIKTAEEFFNLMQRCHMFSEDNLFFVQWCLVKLGLTSAYEATEEYAQKREEIMETQPLVLFKRRGKSFGKDVEFRIKGNIRHMHMTDVNAFREVVSQRLMIPIRYINVRAIGNGSLILVIQMPELGVNRLCEAVARKDTWLWAEKIMDIHIEGEKCVIMQDKYAQNESTDSTLPNSPDERQKAGSEGPPNRFQKKSAGSSKHPWDVNQHHSDNAGPSQQADESSSQPFAISQQETREKHQNNLAASENLTPSAEDYKTALVNRGVVVQGSGSELALSSSTAIDTSADTSSFIHDQQGLLDVLQSSSSDVDAGCHSNQTQQSSFYDSSIIDRTSNDNLLASSDVAFVADECNIPGVAVPSKCSGDAHGEHACGGVSDASFSDDEVNIADKVPEAPAFVMSSGEDTLPSNQLADVKRTEGGKERVSVPVSLWSWVKQPINRKRLRSCIVVCSLLMVAAVMFLQAIYDVVNTPPKGAASSIDDGTRVDETPRADAPYATAPLATRQEQMWLSILIGCIAGILALVLLFLMIHRSQKWEQSGFHGYLPNLHYVSAESSEYPISLAPIPSVITLLSMENENEDRKQRDLYDCICTGTEKHMFF